MSTRNRTRGAHGNAALVAVVCFGFAGGIAGCASSGVDDVDRASTAISAGASDPQVKRIQSAALRSYNGWIVAQDVSEMPSDRAFRRTIEPYIAKSAIVSQTRSLRKALEEIHAQGNSTEPALVRLTKLVKWRDTKVEGDEATVTFTGYTVIEFVDDPRHNTPDQRFTIKMHRDGSAWKMVSYRMKWGTPAGPLGPEHRDGP